MTKTESVLKLLPANNPPDDIMFIEHSMPACTVNGLWIWPEVSYAFYVLCDLSV
ncbi:UNVERIFIED_CONTAM: hypothetical protein Sradi_5015200 [Sesamum radiatum]|uniref:Uncharacterized protein n=1 Tax=Sesamum radiatum TaxID=300843 RepID=A0AAW2MFT5_SESRA